MNDFGSGGGDNKKGGFFEPIHSASMDNDIKRRQKNDAAKVEAKKAREEKVERRNATQKRDEDRARAMAERNTEGLATGNLDEAPRLLDMREFLTKTSGGGMDFPTVERPMAPDRPGIPGDQFVPGFLRKRF